MLFVDEFIFVDTAVVLRLQFYVYSYYIIFVLLWDEVWLDSFIRYVALQWQCDVRMTNVQHWELYRPHTSVNTNQLSD